MVVALAQTAGVSTCPLCQRTWLVTPEDDCMMPACGEFGFDSSADNTHRPCNACGVKHAWRCEKLGNDPNRPLPEWLVTIDPGEQK